MSTDDATTFVLGFVCFLLAAAFGVTYCAMAFWRRDAKASHQQCMNAWMRLEAEQKHLTRLNQERDSLVRQLDRMTIRIGELKEGAQILGMLASDQLDRMTDAAAAPRADAASNADPGANHADPAR